MNYLKTLLATVFIGSTIAAMLALIFLNLIVAAIFWPESLTIIGGLLNKHWNPSWGLCLLIGFVPFFGRWYVTLLIWGLLKMAA